MENCVVCGEPTKRKVPGKSHTKNNGIKPCELSICVECSK